MSKFISGLIGSAIPSWVVPAAAVVAVLSVLGGAYLKGRSDANANCNAAALRAEIAILKRDADVQKAADEVEAKALVESEALNNSMQMEISDYAEKLKARPDRCPLSGADVERLRKFGR